ncbi:MAG: FAD-dependent oxidoreductase [Hyphomicrobiales bacterium]|nr:FAD-dependent oxidoreductase [Hyphomicrobiales bacterium]
MSATLPNLSKPITLGEHAVRNRILSTGHMTGMISAGVPTARFADYHEARARGGCGLIITESAAVHPTSNAYNIQLTKPEVVEALGQAAERVARHGCRIFGQLGHGGRETHSGTDGSRPVAYGPSAVATERFHVMPRAMSRTMIGDIAGAFGAAAKRYEEAGYHGLEIMASHGLLLAQFLNPDVNRREDDYGGTRENRLRFLRDVITSIRSAVGSRLALGIRISGDELNATGLETPEVVEICKDLDGDGMLDFFDICGGSMSGLGGSVHVVPPMNLEPGYLAPISARVREAVNAPVFVAGRINDVREAENVIARGEADMCGMTRAQICDPAMAAKAIGGALDDIRACIGCNQACIGHMQEGYPISCIQHPETGREAGLGTRAPARKNLKVFIAGGGPAGMKAAAVAAERGHDVTLFEATGELGGQVKLARQLPGRDEFGGIVTNLAREMQRHGVKVQLNSPVDLATVQEGAPDVVVVASGAKPHTPDHLILDGAHVVHAAQVLEGANVGTRVVIADWRCDWVGIGLAERLAADGCYVRLAVNGYMAGHSIQQYTRDRWIGDLHKLGVEVTPFARLAGADEDTAYFEHTTSGEPIVFEDIDTLVTATGSLSDLTLEEQLQDWPGELWIAGDAVAPRTCEEAVLEGLKIGSAIGGGPLAAIDEPLRLR